MAPNFQKGTFLEFGAGGLEPRRRYIAEGRSLLERATNMETEGQYRWGS